MQLRRTTARWACDWACCARSPVIHPAPGIFSLAEMYQCLVVPDQYVARVLLARGLDFGGSLFHFAVLQIERNQSYCSAHMGVIDALRLEECAFCCIFIIADEFQVTQLSPRSGPADQLSTQRPGAPWLHHSCGATSSTWPTAGTRGNSRQTFAWRSGIGGSPLHMAQADLGVATLPKILARFNARGLRSGLNVVQHLLVLLLDQECFPDNTLMDSSLRPGPWPCRSSFSAASPSGVLM